MTTLRQPTHQFIASLNKTHASVYCFPTTTHTSVYCFPTTWHQQHQFTVSRQQTCKQVQAQNINCMHKISPSSEQTSKLNPIKGTKTQTKQQLIFTRNFITLQKKEDGRQKNTALTWSWKLPLKHSSNRTLRESFHHIGVDPALQQRDFHHLQGFHHTQIEGHLGPAQTKRHGGWNSPSRNWHHQAPCSCVLVITWWWCSSHTSAMCSSVWWHPSLDNLPCI